MLRCTGKVWRATGGNNHCHVIYIPADIVKDSAYPFQLLDKVDIQIDKKNNCLIIKKTKEEKGDER